jgi:hypothetical protein
MHTRAADSPASEIPTDVSNGWGTDHSPLERPGIPQEQDPPRRLASAHWLDLEQQASTPMPLVGQGMQLTPVFSSAVPPRGVSGALRRLAYRIPDYRARRWLLLMVADRIDVVEHRPGRLIGALVALTLISVGALTVRRLVRR